MRPSGLSARLPIVATVGRHPAVWLIGRGPIPLPYVCPRKDALPGGRRALPGVSPGYSREGGRLPTRYSPVRRFMHELMKDGGLGESLLFPPSHLEKPVLNGLSDLLRLPQYPVLGVRAAASAGVRREGELYAHVRAGASVRASVHETHTNWGIIVV